ncbi:MAG: putative sulfate exporter family transporter [Acidobacteria bacterium]|nr:MAG: putative sulfate exporter family transporter [Acidobacteriota bacterium]
MSTVTTLPVIDARRPSTLREPQGRPERRRGATGSGRPQPVERGAPPWVQIVPGTILLAAVGFAGKIAEQSIAAYGRAHQLTLPNIEYVLWAIVFGLIVSNTVGVPAVCRKGVDTYEFWLKVGIVLLGVRFLLGDVVKLGTVSLVCVALELAVAILVMTALGRAFRLPPKLISLLSIGSSICGVSAIIAAKGAIEADDEDASYAIAAILALGAVSLFVFPVIGHAFAMSDQAYGLWVGLAVDNTAEATAAGALFSDTAGRFAVLAKTTRNATIGFVVLGYALHWARVRARGAGVGNKAAFLWEKFPKFVLGFVIVSALATAGLFTRGEVADLANLSRWAFLLTFAGVGLRTNVSELARQGWRPLIVGVVGECVIAVITLVMVLAAARAFS